MLICNNNRHWVADMLPQTIQRRPETETKSTAYADLGAVLSHLSRSWQLVRRSVAAL